jgi:hypothetical protein
MKKKKKLRHMCGAIKGGASRLLVLYGMKTGLFWARWHHDIISGTLAHIPGGA